MSAEIVSQKVQDVILAIIKTVFVLGVVTVFVLVGVMHSPIINGTVVKKSFEPAEYHIQTDRTTHIVGKVPISRRRDYIYEYPDRYIIVLSGETIFNQINEFKVYVNKETYEKLSVGDTYTIKKDIDTLNEPYNKYKYIEGVTPLPNVPYVAPKNN